MDVGITHEEFETTILFNQCNAEIARLEALLDEQRRIRRRLNRKLSIIRYRKSPSAIDRTPSELLHQIFEVVVSDDLRDIQAIAMVYRHWNYLICSSPTLWNTIKISLAPDFDTVERDTKLLEHAIIKSGVLPLYVNLQFPGFDDICHVVASKLLPVKNPNGSAANALRRDYLHVFITKVLKGLDLSAQVNIVDKQIDTEFVPYGFVFAAMSRFMTTLSGHLGRNLLRVRTLSFFWADQNFQELLARKFFHFPTPALHELRLRNHQTKKGRCFRLFIHHVPNLVRISTNLCLNTVKLVQMNQVVELDITLRDTSGRRLCPT